LILRIYIFGFLLLLATPVWGGFGLEGQIHLIEDGRTDYRIIVEPSAASIEMFAARELQGYVMQVSGVFLPLDRQAAPTTGKRIIVGSGAIDSLGLEVDRNYLDRDGFVIRTVGDRLILAGGRPRGTLYGVYTFLQMLGCRWLAPGILGEVIPQSLEIAMDQLDLLERPDLKYRGFTSLITTNGEGTQWLDWMGKNRMNYVMIPLSNYADFKRILGGEVRKRDMDLGVIFDGLTIEDESKLADGVLKFIAKNREVDIVVLQLPEADSSDGQCAESVAEVADMVRDQFPGKFISLLTTGAENISDGNFLPYFAPANRCYRHSLSDERCEINAKIRGNLEEQLKSHQRVHVYEHYMGSYSQNSLPFPILHAIASDIKYFHESAALEGVVSQCEVGNWGAYGLNYYLFARMAWNADDNLDDVVSDYCDKYYGSAGEPMKKYFTRLEDAAAGMEHLGYIDPPHLILELLDEKSLTDLEMELYSAVDLANDAMDFDRIRKTQLSLEHANLLWHTLNYYFRAIQFQEAENNESAMGYFQKAAEAGEETITFLFKNVDEGVFIIPESYIFEYLEPLILDARVRKDQIESQ